MFYKHLQYKNNWLIVIGVRFHDSTTQIDTLKMIYWWQRKCPFANEWNAILWPKIHWFMPKHDQQQQHSNDEDNKIEATWDGFFSTFPIAWIDGPMPVNACFRHPVYEYDEYITYETGPKTLCLSLGRCVISCLLSTQRLKMPFAHIRVIKRTMPPIWKWLLLSIYFYDHFCLVGQIGAHCTQCASVVAAAAAAGQETFFSRATRRNGMMHESKSIASEILYLCVCECWA